MHPVSITFVMMLVMSFMIINLLQDNKQYHATREPQYNISTTLCYSQFITSYFLSSSICTNLFNLHTVLLSFLSSFTVSHLLYAYVTTLFISLILKALRPLDLIYSQPFLLFHPGCHHITCLLIH